MIVQRTTILLLSVVVALIGPATAFAQSEPDLIPASDLLLVQDSQAWLFAGLGIVAPLQWRSYHHGFSRVSEAQFLRTAGYPDEAARAERHQRTNRVLWISGLSGLAVGGLSLWANTSISVPEISNRSNADLLRVLKNLTGVTTVLGFSAGSASVLTATIRGRYTIPIVLAHEIALEHNNGLLARER